MKRSEFLKRLGIGIVAIPLVPKIVAEVAETVQEFKYPPMRDTTGEQLAKRMSADEVMDIYHETGDLVYSHYEEPWIHQKGWPLRINDIILTPDEKQYVVTSLSTGGLYGEMTATCMPLIDGPEILLTEETSKDVLIIPNINSKL